MHKGAIFIAIILIILIIAGVVVVAGGGIGGYKVIVTGKATIFLGGWGLEKGQIMTEHDDSLLDIQPMGFFRMPWESADINVVVKLTNPHEKKVYTCDQWISSANLISGSSGFSVEVRHVPQGHYACDVYVYEVDKFWIFESSRTLRAQKFFGAVHAQP